MIYDEFSKMSEAAQRYEFEAMRDRIAELEEQIRILTDRDYE